MRSTLGSFADAAEATGMKIANPNATRCKAADSRAPECPAAMCLKRAESASERSATKQRRDS